ncbi:MAG: hypothetical protein HY737_04240 [Candidatus Omnitrophica bacterium]|nr:hypothetical protein [Candidatus Omnitrophota bacterium]
MITVIKEKRKRGFVLISSFMVLTVFLVYSGALSQRAAAQRLSVEHLRDALQARDLAQASLQQLREDFYQFLAADVYQLRYQGNALAALQWLDAFDEQPPQDLDPPFALEADDTYHVAGLGTQASPRSVAFSSGTGEAWISSVETTNPDDTLSPRRITVIGQATVGGITKQLQATYDIALGVSDIFRYAYFVNNYGWFDIRGGASVVVNGEVRANGDLDFTSDVVSGGQLTKIYVNGDLYASENDELINPETGLAAVGTITGNPTQTASWNAYWDYKRSDQRARPAQQITAAGQPAISGATAALGAGYGWHASAPEQVRFSQQPVQDMPYLGNLSLYKSLAASHNDGAGSTLKYYENSQWKTITATYQGPDGAAETGDEKQPIVLIGTSTNPIKIDGPVVIPGDVIIRGYVSGRGTIYTGRNLHVVGSIVYKNPSGWASLERYEATDVVRQYNTTSGIMSNLGKVCNDGTYVAPNGAAPEGC